MVLLETLKNKFLLGLIIPHYINRNICKFNLPYIWDRVLVSTPGLNLKRHVQAVGHANPNTPY